MASSRIAKETAQQVPWLHESIVIEAAPKPIWRFVDTSDLNLLKTYIPGIVDLAPALPHGDRDRMIGSKQSVTIRARSFEIGFELLITKYEYLKLYGFIFLRHGVALGEQTTHLASGEGGTLVTMSYERLGRFWIQQFLRPLILRRYVRALNSLKLAVEGGSPS